MNEAAISGLKALSHTLRFRIVESLGDGERNVGEIEQATGIGQPTLSQQLSVLRKAGLVTTRKQAKLVYYRADAAELAALAAMIGDLVPQAADREHSGNQLPSGVANFARISG